MAAAHATASRQVVADELAVLDDGDEAHALGEDVDVVHRRDDEADLELPRQVGLAVERVDKVFVLGRIQVELHAVDPDGVVGLGLREQGLGDFLGIFVHLLASDADGRHGRGHDVAIHITAGGQGVDHGLIDLAHERAETVLDHTVKLDALTGGQAQGVVGALGGEIVEGDPLAGTQDAARDAAADHPDVLLAALAEVAIVLLINAVEFDELLVVCGKAGKRGVRQSGGDVPGQGRNGRLEFFVAARLLLGGGGGAHFLGTGFPRRATGGGIIADGGSESMAENTDTR